MRQSNNIKSSKETHTILRPDYTIFQNIVMVCTIMLVSQHQSNFLGLHFNELKFDFIKDKHFSLYQIKIVQRLFFCSLKHITEMAELTLKFFQVSVKCHCLKSLVWHNIPVRKLNTVYVVFWTGSKQSDCPAQRFSTTVKHKSILEKKPKQKTNQKNPK